MTSAETEFISSQLGRDEAWFGYTPDPESTARYNDSLDPIPAEILNPHYQGPEDQFLYRALMACMPSWIPHYQKIGDCVSHGGAHTFDVATCVDFVSGEFDLSGFRADLGLGAQGPYVPVATEPLYGTCRVEANGRNSGGGFSDGSTGSDQARAITRTCKGGKTQPSGGVLFRISYPGYDFTTYSGSVAKKLGDAGLPDSLESLAAKFYAKEAVAVTTFEQAIALIGNGYAISVCSNQGFTSRRDKDGFASPSGTWYHCMSFVAKRGGSRPGLLCQNSWGSDWISGPKFPDDQPDGSFWVDASVCNRMLGQRDSYAFGVFLGLRRRPVDYSSIWA